MQKDVEAPSASMDQISAIEAERLGFKDGWGQLMAMSPAIAAWGMVTGMAMVKAGLTVWQSLGMTLFVYAGSVQLASLPLIQTNVPIGLIFLTATMLNLRYFIFSAMTAPHMAHLPMYQRVTRAFLVTDVVIALSAQRFNHQTLDRPAGKLGFATGTCMGFWVMWQLGSVIGIFMASQIPESWQIAFTGTIALIAVLIPMINRFPTLVAAVVSGIVAIVTYGLPYRLGLLCATIAGICAAVGVEQYLIKQVARGEKRW
jgi:predicted branched-subunit amino acid permease